MTEPTTPRKDFLKMAFDGLETGTKSDLEDLRAKFDQKTKNAIEDLIKKKPDGVPKDILSETQNILNEFRHRDYHKLTIKEKGDLQRWALRKKLDSKTVEGLADINVKNQSRDDPQGGATSYATSIPLDELLLVCGEQKAVAELKNKIFKFLGKEIKLDSLWASIVDTINKLKSVGDTAASSNQTAGLVWGIFKVLLQFAVMSEKGAEAAFSGMQTAVNVMQRTATYEKHIYDPAGHQALTQSATEPFEWCLISTYQRVFKFFLIASKCFTKSKASLCWYVFWSDKDILEFEQDIFKYEQKLFQDSAIKSLIDQGSKASIIHTLVKDMNAQILGTQESIVGILSQQSGATLLFQRLESKVHDIQSLMRKDRPDATRDEMLGWFPAARVEDHHRSANDKRTTDTAEWILKKQHYLDWSSDSGPSLLWIKGISGAGKTTIISRLVDTYHESVESVDSFAQPHVAYFYCKQDAADRRFSENIFRSFIRQLASAYHPLPERLVETYREKSPPSSLSSRLYEEDYEALLTELIPKSTETVLILDALDECVGDDTRSSQEINKVLKTLSRLLSKPLPIKIVVASRYDSRIEDSFRGSRVIEISADDNSTDVKKMVVARIDDYSLKGPTVRIDENMKAKILEVFYRKSQGKFQWATLHIDHVLDGLTDRIIPGILSLEETLGELPEGLIDTYNEIIHRITTTLSNRQKETAYRVFKWLLAMGTCDEKVLIAAVCQRLQGKPGDYPNRVEGDAGYILTACQHLVTIQDSKFRFSHLSVQEYLEAYQPQLVDTCHYDVAKVCAAVLFRYRTDEGAMEPWSYYCQKVGFSLPLICNGHPNFMNELWHFACNQWYAHFVRIPSPSHRKDIRTIVDDSFPSAFNTWLTVRVTGLTRLKRPFPGVFDYSYLGLASFWKVSIGEQLWAKPLPLLDESNESIRDSILIDTAFSCGVLNKLQWLVKKSMTRELSPGGCERRHQDIQSLLDQLFRPMSEAESGRARIGMDGRTSPTELATQLFDLGHITSGQQEFLALCESFIRWRQTAMDTISLNMNPRKSFENLFSKHPLQDQHAEQCYAELARLILLYISPIGDEALGDFLFGRFPHVNEIQYQHLVPPIGFDLDSALVQAATRADSRYIDLLLSHGANKNIVTLEGAPLMAALSNERFKNAEVLLQAGADIDGVNLNPARGYGNITIMACSIQDSTLFRFLRKHDAIDMDSVAETGTCLTPLIAACHYGHIDRVKLLLSMGVEFDKRVTTGPFANALCAAVEGESMRAIRQLLRRNLSYPKEDAIEIWRKKHLGDCTPEYSASIPKKCQTFLCWLMLALLQHPHGHGLNDTLVTDCDEIGHGSDDPDDYLWDGYGGGSDEGEDEDDGYDRTDHGEDERDRGGKPEEQQGKAWEQRNDSGVESGTDSNSPTLRTAGRDEKVLKNINDLLSWLYQDCVQKPQVVQCELAETFGFPSTKQNVYGFGIRSRNVSGFQAWEEKILAFRAVKQKGDTALEIVRNALLKGFQNVLRLSHKQRTLDDITMTWARFLDLAEDSMGSVSVFKNAFDEGDMVELNRLHKDVERLANGGV